MVNLDGHQAQSGGEMSLLEYLGGAYDLVREGCPVDDEEKHLIDLLSRELTKKQRTGERASHDEGEEKLMFEGVIGNNEAKKALFENVVVPIRLKDKLKEGKLLVGVRKVGKNSILLHGPPGNGKSSLVQAAANEAKATLISVRPSDILSKFHGESENILKNIFDSAEKSQFGTHKPAIIFFDEFDSLASTRGTFDDAAASSRRLVSELLLALNTSKCTVVAATNRIEDIDEAAVRRFALKVHVNVPETRRTRMRLIIHFLTTSHIPHKLSPADVEEIAEWTTGWSGSDIEDICREAAMGIIRRISGVHEQCCETSAASEDLEPYDYEMALAALEKSLTHQSDNHQEPKDFVTLSDFQRAYASVSIGFEVEEEEAKDAEEVTKV